jgi:hypothetical protein
VRCTPSHTGPTVGTLYVTSNDPDSPATAVSLVCNGPAPTTTTSTTSAPTTSAPTTTTPTTSTSTTTTLCPDPDGDGICSATDNCPADANPGQEDLDEDGAGDVCDASDSILTLAKVKIRRTTNVSKPNGKVTVKGTMGDGDVFSTAQNLTLGVQDSSTTSVSRGWTAAECITSPTGKVTCKSTDRLAKLTARPVKNAPGQLKFSASAKGLTIAGPFSGPTFALVSQGNPLTGIDRTGSVGTCTTTANQISCKAP